jgi:uncharacterized membrane protein
LPEYQVTLLFVPDTDRVFVAPVYKVADDLLILIGAFTVILLVNFFPATDAVIVAVPGAFAVTFPLEDTVATDFLPEYQVTLLFVPDTDRVFVEPVYKVVDELLILIGAFTVILLVNFFPATDAVIVADPGAFAVTFPLEDTVATDLLLEDQVTLRFVPDTVKVLTEPVYNVADVLLIRIVAA